VQDHGSGRAECAVPFDGQRSDFVEDRGHTFGAGLADADKRALIEYLKMF